MQEKKYILKNANFATNFYFCIFYISIFLQMYHVFVNAFIYLLKKNAIFFFYSCKNCNIKVYIRINKLHFQPTEANDQYIFKDKVPLFISPFLRKQK